MKVSIVIVNFNVKYFIDQCIASIKHSECDFNYEIIVVDNASTDGSAEFIKAKHPNVHLIENPQNIGFSKANNLGVSKSVGEFVLILNPDTLLSTNTLQVCVDFLEDKPQAGIVGVRMYDGSGGYLPESKRGFPTPFVSFCKIFGLSHLFPKSRAFNQYYLGYLDADENQEVDILTGAFMFLRKKVFEEVKGFDEDYFMYGEDIDLSYRIQKAGYENYYVQDTSIIHYKGESTRKMSFDYVKRFYEAMIIFAKKHTKGSKVLAYTFAIKSAIYLNAIVTFFTRFIKCVATPIRDAIVFALSFYIMKYFWANYYFKIEDYFPDISVFRNIAIYIGVSILSFLLLGKYHKTFKSWRWVKILSLTMLALLVIYSLFPSDYRFSRAVLVLGMMLGGVVIYFVDQLMARTRSASKTAMHRSVVIGEPQNSDKLLALLDRREKSKLIGFINPNAGQELLDNFIGSLDSIESAIRFHNINEVIFDQKSVNATEIMRIMTTLDETCEYKIFRSDTGSVVGSYSKEFQGQIDTFDVEYAISTSYNRFIKRGVDLFLSMIGLILFPIGLFLNRFRLGYFYAMFAVLSGKKTFVGYILPERAKLVLPSLRPSVIQHLDEQSALPLNDAQKMHLNFIYAREYSVWIDIRTFFNQLTKLSS